MADVFPDVAGYCPMGCGMTLVLAGQEWAGEGNITCSAEGCPDPGRAHAILQDPETEHIAILREPVEVDGEQSQPFSMQHPLRERAEGELFDCEVQRRLLESEPRPPGRYRVTIHRPDAYSESYRPGDSGLDFEALDG